MGSPVDGCSLPVVGGGERPLVVGDAVVERPAFLTPDALDALEEMFLGIRADWEAGR